ncbi:MAG: hypothetical protein ACTHMC_23910 [Pseudobacter sp.]|uniref:hypothetical protein n=1 Tax=Pseudobacter sp. TaxID=2045420 RepID=UPI003F7EE9A2
MNEHQVAGAFHTANLIIRHLKGELSEQELTQLHHWINSSDNNYDLFEALKDADATHVSLQALRSYSAGEAMLRFLRKTNAG